MHNKVAHTLARSFVRSGFRTLRFDHFGRGWSDRPSGKYDVDFYDRALIELLDHVGVDEPFGLAGLSMGGPIVAEFTARGLKVSTLKHAHHEFDIDHPGRDSFRHRAAGAGEVLISSGKRWALMHELNDLPEPTLLDLLNKLAPCDLVLVEGFKGEPMDRIECYRAEVDNAPRARFDDRVLALAVDAPIEDIRQPQLPLEDTKQIADFIAAHLEL